MTCYLPETPNGITVMICPGGGYDHLAITHEGHDLAPWFNAQGITYIVLKYRLPKDGVNYPLIDAQQAMIIVREHAKEWGIDKNKVGIMGCSAGGHLASLLATSCETEAMRPNFQILLYPVITMQLCPSRRQLSPGWRRRCGHAQYFGAHPSLLWAALLYACRIGAGQGHQSAPSS